MVEVLKGIQHLCLCIPSQCLFLLAKKNREGPWQQCMPTTNGFASMRIPIGIYPPNSVIVWSHWNWPPPPSSAHWAWAGTSPTCVCNRLAQKYRHTFHFLYIFVVTFGTFDQRQQGEQWTHWRCQCQPLTDGKFRSTGWFRSVIGGAQCSARWLSSAKQLLLAPTRG